LGEHGAHGKGEVRRRQGLEESDADHPRKASTSVGGIEGDGPPSGVHIGAVGSAETGRCGHRAVVVADTPRDVARLVEGSHDLGREPSRFGEELHDDVRGGVLASLQEREFVDTGQMAQYEVHVTEGSAVPGHPASTLPAVAPVRLSGRG
jgi:hypothetical protein